MKGRKRLLHEDLHAQSCPNQSLWEQTEEADLGTGRSWCVMSFHRGPSQPVEAESEQGLWIFVQLREAGVPLGQAALFS